jgi:SOS response regulatory protein OraA/RecX
VNKQVEKDNNTLEYVVDRFILAGLEYSRIIELSSTLKHSFGIYSEEEVKEKVQNYLLSRGYASMVD